MSLEYSLCPNSAVYVPRGQLMSLSTVYVTSVQFMSPEFSLCPQSTVYVLGVLFMSLWDSLCPQSRVMFP